MRTGRHGPPRRGRGLPLWARTPDNGYSVRNTGEAGSRDKAKAAPGQGELFPAWLAIAAIAHNLLRAAGTLAGRRHAKARAATIPRDLIAVAGAPPATAAATSPSTCPKDRTASTKGSTSGKPPAGHPSQRPDQPRTGPHPRRPPGQPTPALTRRPRTSRRNVSGKANTP